jgi:hypothetical protein
MEWLTRKTVGALGLWLLMVMIFSLAGVAQAETDVTDKVQVIKGRLGYDRVNKQSYLDISVKNISNDVLLTPIKVVISGLTPTTVSVANADGVIEDGSPYFNFTMATGQFLPGATIASKILFFTNPTTARFSFSTKVVGSIYKITTTMNEDGGTFAISDPTNPIFGTKIVVPEDSIDQGDSVTISISYSDQAPGPIPNEAVLSSKVFSFEKNIPDRFKLPVKITIPYSDINLMPDDVPAVFYWNPTYSKYEPVGIKEIDKTNKTVTFTTVHFTEFIALGIPGLAKSLSSIDSGFRSEKDGFFHPNFGSYMTPQGNCLGMANYSVWYYNSKKQLDGNGLFDKYRQGDPAKWEDDSNERELITRAYLASSQIWGNLWLLTDYALGESDTGLLLITTLIITKSPQTFLLKGINLFNSDNNWGHAVTVYKYDVSKGQFYIYDNNFPNEEVTVHWDPLTGFWGYDKTDAYPTVTLIMYGYEAFSSSSESGEFEELYAGAEAGWPTSKFQQINITSHAIDSNNTINVSSSNNITIAGQVTGGEAAANFLVYNINGVDGLGGQLEAIDSNGNFSFTIPNLPLQDNTIMIMSTNNSKDATRRKPSNYAGFKEFKIKVTEQVFITNMGFESGNFEGWLHETHTWQSSNMTTEKNLIVTNGNDPIFTSLQKVYKGTYAVRVNNQDNNYHISSISKTVLVPIENLPALRFYWAAILQDPSHDPAHQPYVRIDVVDNTTGQTIFSKYHYSNDPSYSGWQSVLYNGGWWRTIPWQTVFIDLNESKGHQVTIKVIAADCGYGAHGGYLYFDGDE